MKRESSERPSCPRHSLRGMSATILSLAALIIGTAQVGAQDLSTERFTFRGFGTVGATTHDSDGIEYRRSTGQARGAESGALDFGTNSIAGLQINARLNSQFDVMVQG